MRHFPRWIKGLLSAGLVLLAVFFVCRHLFLVPFLDRLLVSQAQQDLGLDIAIGRISGSGLTGLRITDIRTVSAAPENLVSGLEIKELDLRYSLPALLAGKDAFLARLAVNIDGASLTLDPARAKPAADPFAFILPEILPAAVIRNASLHIKSQGSPTDFDGLAITIAPRQSGLDQQDLKINIDRATALPFPAPVAIVVDLQYSTRAIRLRSLSIDNVPLISAALLQIQDLPHRRLSLDAELLLFEGRCRLTGLLDQRLLTGGLELDFNKLDAYPEFLSKTRLPLSGRAKGQAEFKVDLDDPASLAGHALLQVNDADNPGGPLRRLDLEAAIADGALRLLNSVVLLTDGKIELHDATMPVSLFYSAEPDALLNSISGSFVAETKDLRPFLNPTEIVALEKHALLQKQSFSSAGTIKNGYLHIDRLAARLGDNSLLLNKASLPLAGIFPRVRPYLLLAGSSGEFAVELERLPELLTLAGLPLPSPYTRSTLPAHHLSLAGREQDGKIIFSRGELRAASSSVLLNRGQVILPPAAFSPAATTLQSDLSLQIAELSSFAGLLPLPQLSGALHGRIVLDGSLATLNGALDLKGRRLAFAGLRIEKLQMRAKAGNGLVNLEVLEAVNGKDRLHGSASLQIADRRLKALALHISVKEAADYLQGVLPENLRLKGALAVDLEAVGPLFAPEAKLEARLTDGAVNSIGIPAAALSLVNSGRLLTINRLFFNTSAGNIILSGTARRDAEDRNFAINLATIELQREQAVMRATRPAVISADRGGTIVIHDLSLAGDVGRITAGGTLRTSGKSELWCRVDKLRSTGWLEKPSGNRLYFNGADLNISLHGELRSPKLAVDGTIAEIGSPEAPFPFSGSFAVSYDQQTLNFHRFLWSGQGGKSLLQISGSFPYDLFGAEANPTGKLDLDARLQLPELRSFSKMLPDKFSTGGSLHGALSLRGTMENPAGRLQLTADNIDFPGLGKIRPPGPFHLNCDLLAETDQLSINEFLFNSSALSLVAAGKWLSPPSLAAIASRRVPLLTGALDLTGSLSSPDIGWAAAGLESIRRIGGRFDMEVKLSGPAADPAIKGSISLTNGEIRPANNFPPARMITLAASLNNRNMEIKDMRGELGGAPFSMTGSINEYRSAEPLLDLSLRGDNCLLYRDDEIRLRTDIDLRIQGIMKKLAITGDLTVTDGRFTRNFDLLSLLRGTGRQKNARGLPFFSFREAPLNTAVLRVGIKSKKALQIKNNLSSGAIRPDIIIAGTGEIPVINGKIYIDPITLRLPAGRIDIASGLISFPDVDPDNPLLDLNGKARMLGYDISILVRGSFDEPVITLSSSPPLPDDQLLLLVLAGKAPQSAADDAAAGNRKKGMNVAMYLGKNLLSRLFHGDSPESDESVLDRFEVEIGRGLTRLGEETIETRFRLAAGLFSDNDLLFITAEKDVYDDFNSGVKIVFQFK